MERWMFSLGMFAALALATTSFNLLLVFGSGPPSRTAMAISRPILVNILPRCASVFSFLCLMVDHLLCPDMDDPSNDRLIRLIIPYFAYFRQDRGRYLR